MKKRTLLLTTFVTGLLTFAGASHAKPHFDEMSTEKKSAFIEKRINRMAKKLNLNEEQKASLIALKETSFNETSPLMNEKRTIRKEIRDLDPAASDYSAKLADAANRQAEITRQLILLKGSQYQQLTNILTPEQLAKFNAKMNKRKGKGKRGGKRHHRKHD